MLNLLLLFVSLVLALVAGVMMKPASATAGEMPILPLDCRAAFHVSMAAVVLSCSVVGALVAAYSMNPEAFRSAVARPLDSILQDYHWLLFAGLGLYAVVRLCGIRFRRSLWLLCLSLPGVLTMPVIFVAAVAAGVGRLDEVVLELLIHPATWILSVIAVRQVILLRRPGDIHRLSALAQTFLIVAAYISLVRFPWP